MAPAGLMRHGTKYRGRPLSPVGTVKWGEAAADNDDSASGCTVHVS
jgi:hypothetical protein